MNAVTGRTPRAPGILTISLFATLPLICASAEAVDVEKWVDTLGRVHYGDQPPPGVETEPVRVRPNVIETGPLVQPPPSDVAPAEAASASAPSSALQPSPVDEYVELCRRNRGLDCEQEAREMIYGPARVIFRGDPAVFPRPDVRPRPPGLPLDFRITPRAQDP